MVLVGDPEQLPCTVLSGVCQKKVDKSLLLPFFCAFLKRICLASVKSVFSVVFQSYSPLWFCDPSFLAITNKPTFVTFVPVLHMIGGNSFVLSVSD